MSVTSSRADAAVVGAAVVVVAVDAASTPITGSAAGTASEAARCHSEAFGRRLSE